VSVARAFFALCALLLLAAPARAQAQENSSGLPAAVAEDQVSVGSDYQGAVIRVFGVNPDRRGRGDIVVVVRGPNQPATVMRKRRVFGLWVNGDPVTFSQTPSFFAVLSSRPLQQIVRPGDIWNYELDPAASAELSGETPPDSDPSAYRAALVRLRRAQGLYIELVGKEEGLDVYPGGLFRAVVRLPANAPIAEYLADAYVFRNGRLISSQRVVIRIARAGVERRIHDLATNASLVYGILTVLMALGAGWAAAFLFRRG
jgi:uncharacterized protein (TIGR02186 family)